MTEQTDRLRQMKLELERHIIGAVLCEGHSVYFNYLVAANFTDKVPPTDKQWESQYDLDNTAFSHRKIWSTLLGMWPDETIDLVSVRQKFDNQLMRLYLLQLFGQCYMSIGINHCLQLIELDIRLKIYDAATDFIYQLSKRIGNDPRSQISFQNTSHSFEQIAALAIDTDEDIFEITKDLQTYLISLEMEKEATELAKILNAVDQKVFQLKKQVAFRAAKRNFETQIQEHMSPPQQAAMHKLVAAVEAVYRQTAEPELIDHILSMRINEKH